MSIYVIRTTIHAEVDVVWRLLLRGAGGKHWLPTLRHEGGGEVSPAANSTNIKHSSWTRHLNPPHRLVWERRLLGRLLTARRTAELGRLRNGSVALILRLEFSGLASRLFVRAVPSIRQQLDLFICRVKALAETQAIRTPCPEPADGAGPHRYASAD